MSRVVVVLGSPLVSSAVAVDAAGPVVVERSGAGRLSVVVGVPDVLVSPVEEVEAGPVVSTSVEVGTGAASLVNQTGDSGQAVRRAAARRM